jgi:hypothetical protein
MNVEAQERAGFLAGWKSDDAGDDTEAEPDADDGDLDDETDEDIESDDDDDDITTKPPAKPVKGKPAPAQDDDDESDDKEDDDSDLDEDDDKPADPVVAKGIQKLQRQEQRMRQQFESERAQWKADIARREELLAAKEREAHESKSMLERLKSRVETDPHGVLEELGVKDWDYAAKMAFTRSKAGDVPANKEAAARLQAERELKSKLTDVERKLADREKAEAEAQKHTEMRAKVDTYLGGVVKAATTVTKATLVQKMIAADPDYARARIAEVAGRLYQGGADYPSERAVIVEVEKAERALLRRYGINPRTLVVGATSATSPTDEKKLKAGKASKSANGKARASGDDELKMPSRDELLAEDWSAATT